MPFYTYSQNNSGGGFDIDESRGIGHYVIVEAADSEEADFRAERIGLVFDGVAKGWDCDCCGDRWYYASDYNAADVPSIYGNPVADYPTTNPNQWPANPDRVYVHGADESMTLHLIYPH